MVSELKLYFEESIAKLNLWFQRIEVNEKESKTDFTIFRASKREQI